MFLPRGLYLSCDTHHIHVKKQLNITPTVHYVSIIQFVYGGKFEVCDEF